MYPNTKSCGDNVQVSVAFGALWVAEPTVGRGVGEVMLESVLEALRLAATMEATKVG